MKKNAKWLSTSYDKSPLLRINFNKQRKIEDWSERKHQKDEAENDWFRRTAKPFITGKTKTC